jgi:hypothetical protein
VNHTTQRRLENLEAIRQIFLRCATVIIATDREDADRQLAEIKALGHSAGRDPLLILTGVPRELRTDRKDIGLARLDELNTDGRQLLRNEINRKLNRRAQHGAACR